MKNTHKLFKHLTLKSTDTSKMYHKVQFNIFPSFLHKKLIVAFLSSAASDLSIYLLLHDNALLIRFYEIFFFHSFVSLLTALRVFFLSAECSRVGSNQRFTVHGWHSHSQDGPAQTQNGVRDQPEWLENSVEHTGMSGDHIAPTWKTADPRGCIAVTLDSKPNRSRSYRENSR